MRKLRWISPVSLWAHSALRLAIPASMLIAFFALGSGQGSASPVASGSGGYSAANQSCMSCHVIDARLSHPVGVIPSMNVPESMPLDNGRIACLTCHEDGGPTAHQQSAQTHDAMLREGVTGNFCGQCHTGESHNGPAMHASELIRAHPGFGSRPSLSSGMHGELDGESQGCLTCHDGTLARDIPVSPITGTGDHSSSHPIGLVYEERRPDLAPLVPAIALDERIRLYDGRVGCGSCHSVYSHESNLLVMSNYRSRLCLSCHRD